MMSLKDRTRLIVCLATLKLNPEKMNIKQPLRTGMGKYYCIDAQVENPYIPIYSQIWDYKG